MIIFILSTGGRPLRPSALPPLPPLLSLVSHQLAVCTVCSPDDSSQFEPKKYPRMFFWRPSWHRASFTCRVLVLSSLLPGMCPRSNHVTRQDTCSFGVLCYVSIYPPTCGRFLPLSSRLARYSQFHTPQMAFSVCHVGM